ncbi:uncharacterized protein [Antedon mediterranea]|uniref:uncharacterized protein n=1 Tax=Antedon mediterranea TaxID=105859 RepID=UPI003AF51AE5
MVCCYNSMESILCIVAILRYVGLSYSDENSEEYNDHNDINKPLCDYNVEMVWSSECGSGVIAATPLIADINSDGKLDVITASFSEEVSVMSGDTGQVLEHSHWPFRFPGATFHASPVLYDIDNDGHDEILLTTSNAEIVFLNSKGYQLHDITLKVGHMIVKKNWFDLDISMNPTNIQNVLYENELNSEKQNEGGINQKSGAVNNGEYVSIDAHILATPVICDLNNDGRREELILPVTYYFDKQDYRLPENELKNSGFGDLNIANYLSNGIVVFNLATGEIIFETALELTKTSAEFPAYQLFTPTVIDLDGNSGSLEIVVCTSAGHLIVLDSNGKIRPGFPKSFGTIHGQITVENLDGRGGMELVIIDNSGNVMCLNSAGDVVWEAELSGTSSAGSRVVDLNGDGKLHVIVASNDGSLWAFNGDSGAVVEGWPHQLGGRITSNILITNLQPDVSNTDIIVLGYDGKLYILSSLWQCIQVIDLDEPSLVQVLSADLIDSNSRLELVLATVDGTIICLAVNNDGKVNVITDWRSETPTLNQFTFWNNQFQIVVEEDFKEVTGSTFDISINIEDTRPEQYQWKSYYVTISTGGYQLGDKVNLTSKGVHQLKVPCPHNPLQGIVTVRLTNEFAQEITTTFTARFNMQWQRDVKWLILLPLTSMLMLLLLVFGFPEADLLPRVHSTKDS